MSFIDTPTEVDMEAQLRAATSESDTAWKAILDAYFPKLLEFFYPHVYQSIDWERDYQFLDKELQAITPQAMVGKLYLDKLVQVQARAGLETMVLLHIEIQGQRQAHFPQRLFEYYCRLYLHYQKPILVLAILTDDSPSWRPECYQSVIWGRPVIRFDFYMTKLLDYQDQACSLQESPNPFAWVVLSQLAAIETQGDDHARFQQKFRLARCLYRHDFDREMIISLLIFMDWVLTLPESLAIRYNEKVQQFEEEQGMAYVTSFERIGIQKGIQQGIQQGMQQGIQQGMQQGIQQGMHQGIQQGMQQGIQQGECVVLERLLQRKFCQVPQRYLDKLHEADSETLLKWSETVLGATSLIEIFGE